MVIHMLQNAHTHQWKPGFRPRLGSSGTCSPDFKINSFGMLALEAQYWQNICFKVQLRSCDTNALEHLFSISGIYALQCNFSSSGVPILELVPLEKGHMLQVCLVFVECMLQGTGLTDVEYQHLSSRSVVILCLLQSEGSILAGHMIHRYITAVFDKMFWIGESLQCMLHSTRQQLHIWCSNVRVQKWWVEYFRLLTGQLQIPLALLYWVSSCIIPFPECKPRKCTMFIQLHKLICIGICVSQCKLSVSGAPV